MPAMTAEERDAFLSTPRYGILSSVRADGSPISVPVWYAWDGELVKFFASAESPKMNRLAAEPRVSLLVVNNLDEHEAWVAFDGSITVSDTGGIELAEQLAAAYWDMSDPARQATLESWREASALFRLISFKPERIRSYKD